MDYCLHHSGPYLVARPAEERPLTKQERKAFKILSKVSTTNFLGLTIRNTLQGGKPEDFRRLIKELKSQMEDAPKVVERGIGKEAFEAIQEL